MIEIPVPALIKIGGIDYSVESNSQKDMILDDAACNGIHSERMRNISVLSTLRPQEFSRCLIHEVIHGINAVYLHRVLDEQTVDALSHGLLQVLEQLGVRFVYPEVKKTDA